MQRNSIHIPTLVVGGSSPQRRGGGAKAPRPACIHCNSMHATMHASNATPCMQSCMHPMQLHTCNGTPWMHACNSASYGVGAKMMAPTTPPHYTPRMQLVTQGVVLKGIFPQRGGDAKVRLVAGSWGSGVSSSSGDGGRAVSATLAFPKGIAVDKNDAVYVAEFNGGKVRKVTPGGNISTSCLLYTSPSPRDRQKSRMPSSA